MEEKRCPFCGKTFMPSRNIQVTCGSYNCKKEHAKIRQKMAREGRRIQAQIESAKKEDRIIGHDYGKRQMQKTLALVPKIDTNL